MQSNKVRIGLASIIFILIFSVLTLAFWNFLRETIVIPIYYLIWLGGLILNSIPQEVFLAFLVMISLVIGINTLNKVQLRESRSKAEIKPQEEASRYRYWMNFYAHSYSRPQFVHEVRKLILSILSYQEGFDPLETEQKILKDEIKVPVLVKKLVQKRELVVSQQPRKQLTDWRQWFRVFTRKKELTADSLMNQEIEEVINFIESQLEIHHDRNQL